MNSKLKETIALVATMEISSERKEILQPLIDFIQKKVNENQEVRLNFICTHNSRRSHLSQIWAKAMATHFGIGNFTTYSGGTEATAMFPKVVETLENQGFTIFKIADLENPIYAIKLDENWNPIIGFSKKYDDNFNPKSNFVAIMTCDSADENCPFVAGCEMRIPIKYQDPKISDGTPQMNETYAERSLQIASEMYFVMKSVRLFFTK